MKIASVLTLGEDDWVGPLGARSGRVPAGRKKCSCTRAVLFAYTDRKMCLMPRMGMTTQSGRLFSS